MKLTINGQEQQVQPGQTLEQLVTSLGFKGKAIAVEVNRQLVPRRQHGQTQLSDGDVLEIVTLVGGG